MNNAANFPPNPLGDWEVYFEAARQQPVHFLFTESQAWLPDHGFALDLGCGVGNGSLFLAQRGLVVTSVDTHPFAIETLSQRATQEGINNLRTVHTKIEDFGFNPDEYDVVAATFSLFFVEPTLFSKTWESIVGSLKPGGIFLGQFLGHDDDWAKLGYLAQNEEEILALLSKFNLLSHKHVNRTGTTVQGTEKHWDIHHIIARKHLLP